MPWGISYLMIIKVMKEYYKDAFHIAMLLLYGQLGNCLGLTSGVGRQSGARQQEGSFLLQDYSLFHLFKA